MNIVARAYNRFDIDNTNGTITKTSETERLLDEMNYYLYLERNLPDQRIFFPRLIDTQPVPPVYSFRTELYAYPDLGKYLINDVYTNPWGKAFTTINDVLVQWDKIGVFPNMISYIPSEIAKNARAMYIEKTEKEYDALKHAFFSTSIPFTPLIFAEKNHIINGLDCVNFEFIWPSVKAYIEANLLTYTPVMIHGDCCLSNILFGESHNVVRFVDPRGSFGVKGVYGDRRYDIAKLYHSVDGKYEFIINDRFSIERTKKGNTCNITYSRPNDPGKEQFEEIILSNYSKKDITIITGTIYIGMAARHYDNILRQEAMYYTGVKLLNEGMNL
jgi:hypothetical protein